MRVHRNPQSLALSQQIRFKKNLIRMRIEHEAMVDRVRQEMFGLVSGTTSARTLRKMGHPFSRNRATKRKKGGKFSSIRTLPVNRQSGGLRRSLFKRKKKLREGHVIDVGFSIHYAKYILSPDGTKNMRARGYWREVRRVWAKENLALRKKFKSMN